MFEKQTYTHLHDNHAARLGRLGVARGGAEVASILFANASVGLLKTFGPDKYDLLTQKIADKMITPRIEFYDRLAAKLPTLISQTLDGKPLSELSVNDRAKSYANDIFDNAVVFGTSIIGQGTMQSILDPKVGMPKIAGNDFVQFKKQFGAVALDKGIHFGGLFLWNGTERGKAMNIPMQNSMTNMLTKVFGLNQDMASDISRLTISMSLPNMAGMVGSIGRLDNVYKQELAREIGEGNGLAHR